MELTGKKLALFTSQLTASVRLPKERTRAAMWPSGETCWGTRSLSTILFMLVAHVQGGGAGYAEFLCNHSNIKGIRSRSSCRPNDRRLHEQATEEPGCVQCMNFSSKKRRLCCSSLVSQPKIVSLCQYPLNAGCRSIASCNYAVPKVICPWHIASTWRKYKLAYDCIMLYAPSLERRQKGRVQCS
jgi:hypothetical protein